MINTLVYELQACGMLPATIGGEGAANAIADWQAAHGLQADGVIGPKTADEMHVQWLAAGPAGLITPHFKLAEFLDAGKKCPPEYAANLRRTARVAEVLRRDLFGNVACEVVSGYRSPEVNVASKGKPHSLHMEAVAVDLRPVSFAGQDPWTWRAKINEFVAAGKLPVGGNHVYLGHEHPFVHCDHRGYVARWDADEEALPPRAIA